MFNRAGIRRRLLSLIFVTTLPLFALTLFNLYRDTLDNRRTAAESLRSQAKLIAARVDDHVGNVLSILNSLSHAVIVDRRGVPENETLLKSIRAELPDYFDNLRVSALDGSSLGSSSAGNFSSRGRKYFDEVIQGRSLGVGEPVISRSTGVWTVALARPVFDEDHRVRAVVSVSTRLDRLQQILQPSELPLDTVVALIDGDGRVMARTWEPQRWIGRNISEVPSVRRMLSLKDGAEETLGPDGVTRIAGYASTIAVPWKVYIGVPRETAYASSREELKKSLFVCALTLALALGMAWWASGRIVAPLRRLTRDAEELGKGQLNVRTPISTGDEVGKLAQTFNEMASALENRTRALEESVRARDEFLAVASHELRTPLTPLTIQIQTLLQIVQSGSMSRFPEEKLRRLLGTTDLQLSRLKRLIDDLLDASRISAGPLILRREPTDLGKLTLESVELFRSDAETAKCPVVLQLDEGVQGNWDSSRLAQVVVNLFSNAIKYGAGHPIRLEVGRTERAAFLSIQDQGIGIHEEDRTRIFERYGRAVTSQHFGGVGLGLYITSQIVQAHRGDVRIRSVPGQGSTFIVELPFEQS